MVKFNALEPDFILLDVMLPGKDGWQLCREIRKISSVPIMIITSKGEVFDKVLGLELGADDYLVKPFDTKEILARIKAISRRCGISRPPAEAQTIAYDKLAINLSCYELKINGVIIDAPPKELELLYFLASNPNRVFTRDQLLDEIWGFDYYGDSRTIDVHIKRLRKKLENVSDKWALKTVWGVGYKFETEDSESDPEKPHRQKYKPYPEFAEKKPDREVGATARRNSESKQDEPLTIPDSQDIQA
jgi:DNA-binding response OmpR family regulator